MERMYTGEWAGLPVTPTRSEGILLQTGEEGRIERVKLVKTSDDNEPTLRHKCGGIQVLTAAMARALSLKTDEAVAGGEVKLFADLVLGELLSEQPMRLCSLDGCRWAEVDDENDLSLARRLFRRTIARPVARAI